VSGSFPDISLLGDTAGISDGDPLPGVAPVAKQQGAYVARCILADLKGKRAVTDQGLPSILHTSSVCAHVFGLSRRDCV
jgi:NADH dehydrogenase FAD-containing subunit